MCYKLLKPMTTAPAEVTIAILSDIHHAGPIEQARGEDYEFRNISNPFLRFVDRAYRHLVWLRHPLEQGRQLDRFLAEIGPVDYVVANGDYPCDTAYGGVSDPGSFQSAQECLGKLRSRFGNRVRFTIGDHELGKMMLFGGKGGMRFASWQIATRQLALQPFWQLAVGRYLLLGVASPLVALPAFQADMPSAEWPDWQPLREAHLAEIRAAFDALAPDQRVLLFCHDPTALPFLGREDSVRRRLPQVEQTIIGHLHTNLVLWKSRLLSGIPPIQFLGRNVRRFSAALHEAHYWWQFRVRLCPALSGTELLNDGGYYTVSLDPAAARPAQFIFHPLPR